VTQDIKLDFNIGARDQIPVEVGLVLPDGRLLSLEKVSGEGKQYTLVVRIDSNPDQKSGSKASPKAPKSPKNQIARDQSLRHSHERRPGVKPMQKIAQRGSKPAWKLASRHCGKLAGLRGSMV
jgi:hypothetical protein